MVSVIKILFCFNKVLLIKSCLRHRNSSVCVPSREPSEIPGSLCGGGGDSTADQTNHTTPQSAEKTHTRVHTHSFVAPPLYFGLIVQPEDEVGEQLEQVLPQQHSHVKVNVAYVRLAHVPGVAHVAHAHKLVDEVAAVASVLTGVGLALVHFLLTPAHTEAKFSQGGRSGEEG